MDDATASDRRESRATRRAWPRRVFGVGDEPDPRFTFANERTFLAWIRTALAMIAAGVAMDFLGQDVNSGFRRTVALTLIALGIACSLAAYGRWMANERALRLRRALPPSRLAPAIGYVVASVGLLAVIFTLLRE